MGNHGAVLEALGRKSTNIWATFAAIGGRKSVNIWPTRAAIGGRKSASIWASLLAFGSRRDTRSDFNHRHHYH